MPKPVYPSHKGPSRGEFLIPHPPQATCCDTETSDAALDQAAAAAMFTFLEDGSIKPAAEEDACAKTLSVSREVDLIRTSFAQHRELATLLRELKTAIFVDFEEVLTSARNEFCHHRELLERQASLTDKLLQYLVHHGDASAAIVGHPMEDLTVQYDYLASYDPSKLDHHTQYDEIDEDKETNLLKSSVETAKPGESERKVRASQKLRQSTSGDAGSLVQQGVEQHMRHKVFAHQTASDAEDLCVPEYKVEDLYYKTGVAQAIARSEIFQNITLLVIVFNAIYIGIDADHNKSDSISEAHVGFQVCEYWFFSYFFLEWITRFGAFQSKLDCLRDMWFKFDTALVFMMVFENTFLPIIMGGAGIPIPTSMIKLVRLMRLARMARLLRSLPELMAMIKGVRMSLRAVGSALLLLLILVYIFSIIVFVLLKDKFDILVDSNGVFFAKAYFGTLSLTMWTLLVDGAFMDSYGSLSRKLLDSDQWLIFFVLIIFVLASALTVMNMLIGVLCEVVTGVAASEKEEADVRLVKETLMRMLMDLDDTGDSKISRDEMAGVIENDTALAVLKSMQVNPSYLMEHVEMYFEDTADGNLAIVEILDLILMLRGDRAPTVKDVLHGQHFQRWKVMQYLRQQEKQMSSWLATLELKGYFRDPK